MSYQNRYPMIGRKRYKKRLYKYGSMRGGVRLQCVQCTKPVVIGVKDKYNNGKIQRLQVACGKCPACRVRRSSDWTLRLSHEYSLHEHKGIFLTLTYDDKHIPTFQSVIKKDLQDFIKRLRKKIYPRKIKYFACGEYGSKNNRPHYHLILFGVDNQSKSDRRACMESWAPYNDSKCDWSKLNPVGS